DIEQSAAPRANPLLRPAEAPPAQRVCERLAMFILEDGRQHASHHFGASPAKQELGGRVPLANRSSSIEADRPHWHRVDERTRRREHAGRALCAYRPDPAYNPSFQLARAILDAAGRLNQERAG